MFNTYSYAAGLDFTAFTQTVTFLAGQTDAQQPVSVNTQEDAFKEDDETITCTLVDSPAPPTVILLPPDTATITIQDDDGKGSMVK